MRRVPVDTNVLISALVFPTGVPALAFWHVVAEERLLLAGLEYELLPVADLSIPMRDGDDQPILDAAIAGAVDIILTGDKDFHALGLVRPRVLTARAYLDLTG